MDNVKINLEELEKVLRQREKFDYSTQPIEFLWGYDSTLIAAVPELITRIRERENECFKLQKRVQELKRQLEILARNLAETPWCLACQVKICSNVGKNIDPMLVDRNECKNVLIRWVEQTIKE